MNYKKSLYQKYSSTHIVTRKGEATLDEFKWRANMYQKEFGKFLPGDRSSQNIDLGCGNGSVVWWLNQIGYANVFGIDISPEQIEAGKALGLKNIEKGDVKEFLCNKKNHYDTIFARDIIEHFDKAEVIEALSLCYGALKSNGKIIIQVPNAESPFASRLRYGDFTHEMAFTSSSLSQVLMIAGFTKIECYPRGPVVSGIKSLVRFVLWKIVEKLYLFLLFAEIGRGKKIVTQGIIAVAIK